MSFKNGLFLLLLCSLVAVSAPAGAREIQTGIYGLTVSSNFPLTAQGLGADGYKLAAVNADKANLDVLQNAGMKGLAAFWLSEDTANDPAKWQDFLVRLRAKVIELKAHPALYAWYLVDEPDGKGIDPAKLKAARAVIKGVDAVTPMIVVLDKPQKWARYLPYFDIVAVDPYLRKTTFGYESPEVVTTWLRQLKKDQKKLKLRSKVWVVLGAFDTKPKDPAAVTGYLKPTPQQFNSMISMALAENVDGILVYTYAFKENDRYYSWNLQAEDPALWEAVRALPQKVRQ